MMKSFKSLTAEPLVRESNLLGEGPIWSVSGRRLLWTDILGKCLYSLDPDSAQFRRHELPTYVACAGEIESAKDTPWEMIAATGFGWLLFQSDLASYEALAEVPFDAGSVRFNDGKVGPDGAFWVGTMDLNARDPLGVLYRLSARCAGDSPGECAKQAEYWTEVREMERGLTISNGIDWSPDTKKMYLTDSKEGVIYRYDFCAESGTLRNRRVLLQDAGQVGVPDGMAVDADGNLWSASWGGGAVVCYDPEGRKRAQIDLPAVQASSCCFGGDNFDILFITTARDGLTNPGELDGALFACDCAGQGKKPYCFRI